MVQSINGSRTIGYPYGNRYLRPHSKIKSRWIKDLDIKAKTITFRKNRLFYFEFGIGKDFLKQPQKTKIIKNNFTLKLK